jgi:hypothetical protein
VRALDDFEQKHGHYPPTLCQIYAGDQAIVSSIPYNPYSWPDSLCLSDFSNPRPTGAVCYIVERADSAPDSNIVGYWLAVLGSGQRAEPQQPLPDNVGKPLRAVKWFESHPES